MSTCGLKPQPPNVLQHKDSEFYLNVRETFAFWFSYACIIKVELKQISDNPLETDRADTHSELFRIVFELYFAC